MQWLSLVTEDSGVQRLRADNRQPQVARGVDALSPYPQTHPAQLGQDRERLRPTVRDRRNHAGDRRRGERRKKQVPVLLDTRCGSRRGIENRRREALPGDAAEPVLAHINVYA